MINDIKIPNKPKREFVAENLIIDSWEKIQPLFDDLLERKINNVNELEKWMSDRSELAAVLEEDLAWRYIKMNIDTTDKDKSEKFHFWINEISPKMSPYSHNLNIKLVECKYIDDLDSDKYKIYIRGVKNYSPSSCFQNPKNKGGGNNLGA